MPPARPRRASRALPDERALWELAAHLFLAERPFSRNRHFAAFDDPRLRPALKLDRRLRALLADLEAAHRDPDARLMLTRDDAREASPCVRLELTSPRSRRTAWLERGAWDVLMRHPRARQALEALRQR